MTNEMCEDSQAARAVTIRCGAVVMIRDIYLPAGHLSSKLGFLMRTEEIEVITIIRKYGGRGENSYVCMYACIYLNSEPERYEA
jgi:hypothetical protein